MLNEKHPYKKSYFHKLCWKTRQFSSTLKLQTTLNRQQKEISIIEWKIQMSNVPIEPNAKSSPTADGVRSSDAKTK